MSRADLPDLSAMLKVGQIRCIQSTREPPALRNPDTLVRRLLSPAQRWSCFWRGRVLLPRLRADPFYYYVLARTRYYDQVFTDALRDGIQLVVNIGCGSDTRAHRLAAGLGGEGVCVLECDQPEAIRAKREIANERMPGRHVAYMPLDLNDARWPVLEHWLARHAGSDMLVMMEGVSPYVDELRFLAFLRMLGTRLSVGSRVAYDFKLRGVADAFGRSGRTERPFRLPLDPAAARDVHAAIGWRVDHFESSADLVRRLLPTLATSPRRPPFASDGLLQLRPLR